MVWLILGVLTWSLVHLSQFLAPRLRSTLIGRLGENPYKGLFSILIIASLVLMVLGWRNSVPHPVFPTPAWGRIVTLILSGVAMILFVSSGMPTNIRRFLRHPQLTGFALWSVAHLPANTDHRSLILFGGLAGWAVLEILFINRRDGIWTKPAAVPFKRDLLPIFVGTIAYVILLWAHPWITGVRLI